jgi:hypothetical protein
MNSKFASRAAYHLLSPAGQVTNRRRRLLFRFRGHANRQNLARPALRGLEGRLILCVLYDLVFDGRAWKGEKKLAHEI